MVTKGAARAEYLASAETWLRRVPHASGQNHVVADPEAARSFECSAGKKVEFKPHEDADITSHTNHPLANTDWHPDHVEKCTELGRKPEDGLRVGHRSGVLKKRFLPGQTIDIEKIQAALASRDNPRGPICGDWTSCRSNFVLEQQPMLLLALGRPERDA